MSRILFTFGFLFLFTAPALALRAAPDVQVACTKDARACPDGSSVGRIGPRCQFAPCPGETNPDDVSEKPSAPPPQVMCTMEAKICPDGSGVGRTGPHCEFAPCPGEAGHNKNLPGEEGYVAPEPPAPEEDENGSEGDGVEGAPGSPPPDMDE